MKKRLILSVFLLMISVISMYGMGEDASAACAAAGSSTYTTGISSSSSDEYRMLSDIRRGQDARSCGEYANMPGNSAYCTFDSPRPDEEQVVRKVQLKEEVMNIQLLSFFDDLPSDTEGNIAKFDRIVTLTDSLKK